MSDTPYRSLRDDGWDEANRHKWIQSERAGYDLGEGFPGVAGQDGDALIHALIAAGGQDEEWLTSAQLSDAHVRISKASYDAWTADVPAALMPRRVARPAARPSRERRGERDDRRRSHDSRIDRARNAQAPPRERGTAENAPRRRA